MLCVPIVVVGFAGGEEILPSSGSSTDGDIFGDVSPAKVAFRSPPLERVGHCHRRDET